MARSAEEAALMLEVLSAKGGYLARARAGVDGLTVAVARNWTARHPGTADLFDEAVRRLGAAGAVVKDVTAAEPSKAEYDDELTVMLCELLDGLGAYLPTRGPEGPQDLAQVVAHEKAHAATELAHFGHDGFEQAIELGGTGTDAYREARSRNLAWALGTCLEPAMAGVEVLVAPTYAPAWKIDYVLGDSGAKSSPVAMAPAIAGWPIATAPMGLAGGLPVGLGAVGRPGSEGALLAVCRCIEQPGRPSFRPPGRG
jgi:amidase